MAEKLRFGLVGCGVIGPLHAQALASLADCELCAATDCVAERAERLAVQYGAQAYIDMDEMLAREQLDVVTVCTPSGLHGEHACRAMRAGCHVIVEKPMEIRREAIDQMLRVQAEQKVKLAVISQHRFDPAVQKVRELVEDGAFGRQVLGNAVIPWWRSQAYYDSGEWRGTWELDGGGILMNQSIHYIDLLQWMMGPVVSIRAYTDTLVHRMETENVATAVLRFASGALGTISATTGAYPGLAARLELLGAQGSAVIEGDELSYLHLAHDEQEAVGDYGAGGKVGKIEVSAPGQSAVSDPAALAWRSHALQIADMLRAIREDGTPLVDGHAARRPVEIILGIYEAARTGLEVVLQCFAFQLLPTKFRPIWASNLQCWAESRSVFSICAVLLSVCTGALVLAKAGLLKGLSATTHFQAFDELADLAPNTTLCPEKRYVDNGNIVLSAGVSAGIDMALYVVGRLLGEEQADKTARYIQYDYWPRQA